MGELEKINRRYFMKIKKVSILIISFALLFFFLFKSSDLLGQLADLAIEQVKEMLGDFPTPPKKFFICKKNRDCTLAKDHCGTTIAVRKSYKRKYNAWRKKAFSGYTFDCMNDLFYYEPQCINFKCKEIKIETDKCDTDEDCALVRKDCCGCFNLAIHRSKMGSYTDEFNHRCREADCSLDKENKQKCATGPDRPFPRCLKSQCVIERR